MTRPNLTPWYAVGNGYKRAQRRPYAEMETYPAAGGWRWRVDRIAPKSGRFETVAEGMAPGEASAKRAAVDSAAALR